MIIFDEGINFSFYSNEAFKIDLVKIHVTGC